MSAKVMTVAGDQMVRACELLNRVPPVKGIPPSNFVGLECVDGFLRMRLSASVCVDVRLEGDLDLPPECGLDRRILFPFVSEPDGVYTLGVEDETAIGVRHGRRRSRMLTVHAPWSYGEWDALENGREVDLPDGFGELLEAGALCASRDPMTPRLNAVYGEIADRSISLSCNNLVMVRATKKADTPEELPATEKVLLPIALVDLLIKERRHGTSRITVFPEAAGFQTAETRIWASVKADAVDGFPVEKLSDLLSRVGQAEKFLQCSARDLAAAAKRFSGYLAGVPSPEWVMEIRCGESAGGLGLDGAELRGQTEYARFVDWIACKGSSSEPLSVSLSMLLPVLEFLAARRKEITIAAADKFYAVVVEGEYEFLFGRRAR